MRRARAILLAALALALATGAPAALAGKPVGITESFPTRCAVEDVSTAPGGGAWFACTEYILGRHGLFYGRAKAGRISPAGTVTEIAGGFPKETTPDRTPGVTAADGSFWFPVDGKPGAFGKQAPAPTLARVTPAGAITQIYAGVTVEPQTIAAESKPRCRRGTDVRHEDAGIAGEAGAFAGDPCLRSAVDLRHL